MSKDREKKLLAQELSERWDDLEDVGVAEQAAFNIACSELGLDSDEGMTLLAEYGEDDG